MAEIVDTVRERERERERELQSSKKSNLDKRSLKYILCKQHKKDGLYSSCYIVCPFCAL